MKDVKVEVNNSLILLKVNFLTNEIKKGIDLKKFIVNIVFL